MRGGAGTHCGAGGGCWMSLARQNPAFSGFSRPSKLGEILGIFFFPSACACACFVTQTQFRSRPQSKRKRKRKRWEKKNY